jgi:hypothetical protein
MKTVKLSEQTIEQVFRPSFPFTRGNMGINPSDALNRVITNKVGRYFTLDQPRPGVFTLSASTQPSDVRWQLHQHNPKAIGYWSYCEEFESWSAVLAWASRMQAKVLLPEPSEQSDALIAIYKMVFPEWDQIEKFDGWPKCNKTTWQAICSLFMEFDRTHHANVMPGGMWMNNGFSSHGGEHLKDWEVELCPVTLAEVENAA